MPKKPDVELLGPGPFSWKGSVVVWLIAGGLLGLIWGMAWHRIGTAGNGLGGLWALTGVIVAFAAFIQYSVLASRNIVVSVEGVRKGKGPGATFIPWQGSILVYDRAKTRFVISAGDKRVVFDWSNFYDLSRYQAVMEYILYVMYEQSFRRHGQARKIEAPIHSLSAAEKAEFLAYRGDGFFKKVFWPYLSWPLLGVCVAYLAFVELLIHHPRLSPDLVHVVNLILRTCPVLFQRPVGPYFFPVAIVTIFVIGSNRLPALLDHGGLKHFRQNWLAQFDKTQRVAISDIGLTQQDADGPSFWIWQDVTRITRTKGLILFHLTPAQTLSVIVPARVFTTPAEAVAFYRQAQAFRRAAQTRPNLVEPISFWEIA